jgi:steroid 5-alpha reductase family enzyme
MLRVFIADLVATLGPIAMIVLYVVISIPMIETKLLAEKPAYAHYQKNTPMLLPKLSQR